MYDYISGKLTVKALECITIDVNGVGYLINIPFKTYEKLVEVNSEEKLFIHLYRNETDMRLYGFKSKVERQIFKKIISVSGIGVKIAVSILSVFTPSEISSIVKSDDYKMLSTVPGLGVKKAQKMIIELKDKLDDIEEDTVGFEVQIIKNDVKMALEALGYEKVKIEDYMDDEEIKIMVDSGSIMKELLRRISKKQKRK